jgi:hypothetical protein
MIRWNQCPFDARLARTPYLVLPKLAIQAMPPEWRTRFDAMLSEMEAVGIETPEYHVFRDDGAGGEYTRARCVNDETGFVRLVKGKDDPWADYRYGDVAELCPKFARLTTEGDTRWATKTDASISPGSNHRHRKTCA